MEAGHVRPGDLPRRGPPGGHRPGLRHGHAAPDPQRLRGHGQRREALPAAGGPGGRRRGRHRRPTIRAEADPQGQDDGPELRDHAAGAREVVTSGHTFNLRELPIVVAGKTGTAEFGVRDSKGLLPFHNWFVAFVPKHRNVAKPDSELAVIGFAYDSNTVGNTATEMVKYYLQLHFNLKHDLRRFDLLRRGNFYGGN